MNRNETIAIGGKESLVSSKSIQECGPSFSYQDDIETLCQNCNIESWPRTSQNFKLNAKPSLGTFTHWQHRELSQKVNPAKDDFTKITKLHKEPSHQEE